MQSVIRTKTEHKVKARAINLHISAVIISTRVDDEEGIAIKSRGHARLA